MNVNGSCLVYLAENGFFGSWVRHGIYRDILNARLRRAHVMFLKWASSNRLATSQPRFTASRLSRKTRTSFPVLSSKAANSKTISFWLAQLAEEFANRPSARALDKDVCTTIWSYTYCLKLMDQNGSLMSEQASNDFYKYAMIHLTSYASLHAKSRATRGASATNRTSWLLSPKLHYFMHCAETVRLTRVNPRNFMLMSGESWIGMVGRMTKTAHRRTLSFRVAQRYLSVMGLKLRAKGAVSAGKPRHRAEKAPR